jgi:hypothetical protein
LKPWLYTIVRNRALNARRDAKTHEPLSEQIDGVAQPADIVLGREELAAVVAAVTALPEQQREALVRSALEGHSHDQIAAALHSSPGAVRQLIYRARLNLRTGVGMLIPLPLVRLLAEHGSETATAASGAAAGSAALGAAGGASVLGKVATVAAIGALAAGASAVIDSSKRDDGRARADTVAEQRQAQDGGGNETAAATPAGAEDVAAPTARDSGKGPGGEGENGNGGGSGASSGSGSASGSDDNGGDSGPSSEPSHEPGDDSGHGGGGPGSSGPGPSDDDDPPAAGDEEDHSGPGGGGSGSSGPGGGSGSDDEPELEPDDPPEPPDEDHSGPGGGGGDDPLDDLPELPEPADGE